MYCLHILLKKAALSLDDGLHPASEGHAGLGHHGLVHGGKTLLNGGDQGGLGSVGTSVSMCLQLAPHKIVQGIEIRTAGRPTVLRNQVVAVVLESLDGPFGDKAGGHVLRAHPRTISCHCLNPGKYDALHDLQIDVRVDPEASLKDVRGPSCPSWRPSGLLVHRKQLARGPWSLSEPLLSSLSRPQFTPVRSAISLSVKMSSFLVRIMTMAHFLLASVHVTSARGPKPVAIVLRLVSVNS
jgi:hypothetical protein